MGGGTQELGMVVETEGTSYQSARLEGVHIEAHEVKDRAGWIMTGSCHRGGPSQSGHLGFLPSSIPP